MARYGYNYLAPTPPKKLRRQIAASVHSQIAPFLNQINRAESQGAGMIGVYSDQLAHSLLDAQRQTRENYGQAEAGQASLNAALAQRLSGAGSSLAGSLASQLAAAGQSTAPAAAVGAVGAGAANAGYATDSASLSALLAQGAAAQQYAGQLPNLARMQGIQQQGLFRAQQEKTRADLLAKLPGLIDSETKQALANEFQKAIAAQSGLVDQQKLAETAAYHSATINARREAVRAQNKRTGMTLRERANYHKRSLAEQARRDQLTAQKLKQQRRQQWYREHSGGKSSGSSKTKSGSTHPPPPSMRKK